MGQYSEKNTKRRYSRWFAAVAAAVMMTAFTLFALRSGCLNERPFVKNYEWESPSYVFSDESGSLVIDSNKTKVSIVNRQNEITGTIRGGTRADDAFYYAESAVIAGGEILVLDVRYTGSGTEVDRSRIFRYDMRGRYLGILFEQRYPPEAMPMQYGNIVKLGVENGEAYFLLKNENKVTIYAVSEGDTQIVRTADIQSVDYLWNYAYSPCEDRLWLTTKTGGLYAENDGKTGYQRIDLSAMRMDPMVLFEVAPVKGAAYCVDLYNGMLFDAVSGRQLIPPVEADNLGSMIYYRVSGSGSRVATTDNVSILMFGQDGEPLYHSSVTPFATGFFAVSTLGWICAGLLCVCIIIAILLIVKKVISIKKQTAVFKITALIVVFIVIAVFITSVNIFVPLINRVDELLLIDLKRTVSTIVDMHGGELSENLRQIDSLDDYDSPQYKAARAVLDPYCDNAYKNGSNMYYVVYKMNDQLLYGVMDYENVVGVVYPSARVEGSGYEDVIFSGDTISVANDRDAYGAWTYVVAPIADKAGETVAVLEIGINLHAQEIENAQQINSLLLKTAVMVLLVILLIVEGAYFMNGMKQRSGLARRDKPVMLRPMVFIMFMASNFASAFMPVLTKRILPDSGGEAFQAIGTALPMSVELLFVSLLAMAGGSLIARAGMRKLMHASVVTQFAGYLISAVSALKMDYWLLMLSRALVGCGLGLSVVSFYAIPNREPGGEKRASMFANLSAGLISGVVLGSAIGAYIAESFGYAAVFFAAAALALLEGALVYTNIFVGKEEISPKSQGEKSYKTWWFISRRRILSFFILVMTPFLIILYFKDYLFPLYAEYNAATDAWIGNVLLFSGVLSIICGPFMTAWLQKKLKEKTVLLVSSCLMILPMMMFGLFPSLNMAVAVVFAISLVSAFGLSAQAIYFSSTPEFAEHGATRSMGVYNLYDNIAQTAGPLLFGALYLLGYGLACLLIGGVSAIALAAFLMISGKERYDGDQI